MYMSESDFDGIFETFVAIFVGIGVAAGLIIGIPCGLAICLTSYCIYKGCRKIDNPNDNVVNSSDVEIAIELHNEVSIDNRDLNEVTIIGGEVLENAHV